MKGCTEHAGVCGDLDSPGFNLLGGVRLDHVQGLVEAAGKGTDVVPDPV